MSEISGLSIASANSPGPLFACKNAGSRNNVSNSLLLKSVPVNQSPQPLNGCSNASVSM